MRLGTTVAMQSTGRGAVRLDRAFQRDWRDERFRLVIGDMVTRVTEWSTPARFAGIRVGTASSLQPTLVAFPLPTLTEAATLPSTLELMSSAGSQKVSVQSGAVHARVSVSFPKAASQLSTGSDV